MQPEERGRGRRGNRLEQLLVIGHRAAASHRKSKLVRARSDGPSSCAMQRAVFASFSVRSRTRPELSRASRRRGTWSCSVCSRDVIEVVRRDVLRDLRCGPAACPASTSARLGPFEPRCSRTSASCCDCDPCRLACTVACLFHERAARCNGIRDGRCTWPRPSPLTFIAFELGSVECRAAFGNAAARRGDASNAERAGRSHAVMTALTSALPDALMSTAVPIEADIDAEPASLTDVVGRRAVLFDANRHVEERAGSSRCSSCACSDSGASVRNRPPRATAIGSSS